MRVRLPILLGLALICAGLAGLWVSDDASGVTTNCGAVAHRLGPTATIDDNTLEGMNRSTGLNARGETDLVPTSDGGFVLYHENLWQQGTSGTGVPWQTTSAYADSLTTLGNSQQVPLLSQALDYAAAHDSRLLIEAHQWTEAWTPDLLAKAYQRVSRRGVDVWWTGTNGMMTAFADIAPDATLMWRVDDDEAPTQTYINAKTIDILQVSPHRSAADIAEWRSWGVKVQGRNTSADEYRVAYDHGLRTVQVPTGGGIKPWLDFCGSQ